MLRNCNAAGVLIAGGVILSLVGGGVARANATTGPVLEATVTDGASIGKPAPAKAGAVVKTSIKPVRATAIVWIDAAGDDARATALIEALEASAAHALPQGKYAVGELRAALEAGKAGDPAAVSAMETAFRKALLDYARDVSSGLLEPRTIDRDLHVFPDRPEPADVIARYASADDPAAFLASLAPSGEDYERLQAELADLSALAPGSWGERVQAGRSIRPGERNARLAMVRARLQAMGDYTPAVEVEDQVAYDFELEQAVRAFQRRHGLNDDGVIGKRTVAAMNVEPEERLGQVVVNLERLRWLNRDLGVRRIMVNQADYNVKLIDNGVVLFDERVVIGKARKHRTPEFSDMMSYLVFNPTWHVPRSIASKEILPLLQEDPEYLSKKNMRLLTRGGEAAPDPTLTDWSLYSANDFPYVIKQRPGGGNALGRVKFMFPNQFNIYLHDTPSKRLFKKDARAFSHGCVRVQDPLRLAELLIEPQKAGASSYIDGVLGRGKERSVKLSEPVPVHLTYRTAWVDDAGVRQFRSDVYGRDARVLSALQAAGVVLSN